MASSRLIVVFILPVIFSIIFGSVVMTDILQKPDRELNMWPMSFSEGSSSHDSSMTIIGLSSQYLISEPIEVQIKVNDSSFSCGDLYITIYTLGKSDTVTQSGFFNQCVKNGNLFPINDKFSEVIVIPGYYELVADLASDGSSNISVTGTFTIK